MDFGDEFLIENYRVPWLIWVQLLVMILLVLVLFLCGFSIFSSDQSSNSSSSGASSSSSSSSSSQSHVKKPLLDNTSSKVERNQTIRGEEEASASKGMLEDEIEEGDDSSAKDLALFRLLRQGGRHPCDYFGLAKQAFLKCFGLGYGSESCRSSNHRKED
ncbi:OLC1v1009033C2 [Oldenlandia corymbosa var. corymbosa]|uniref:OLC1v1009033C2 n=1 Tax=Oldenlandia corymbosa var. corymbosa TaxID=529605 RepID=A0AAV1DQD7_OLDCO|nr:OLC1v1009033C2 [Oldenlandia corymbosa var. corymbosa]